MLLCFWHIALRKSQEWRSECGFLASTARKRLAATAGSVYCFLVPVLSVTLAVEQCVVYKHRMVPK